MKSGQLCQAEEWTSDPSTRLLRAHVPDLRRVQENAIKHGMALAADLARDKGASRTPHQVRLAILHEMELFKLPVDPPSA